MILPPSRGRLYVGVISVCPEIPGDSRRFQEMSGRMWRSYPGVVPYLMLPADLPPSTMYTPPVQKLLSSLDRNSIIRATSVGSP